MSLSCQFLNFRNQSLRTFKKVFYLAFWPMTFSSIKILPKNPDTVFFAFQMFESNRFFHGSRTIHDTDNKVGSEAIPNQGNLIVTPWRQNMMTFWFFMFIGFGILWRRDSSRVQYNLLYCTLNYPNELIFHRNRLKNPVTSKSMEDLKAS